MSIPDASAVAQGYGVYSYKYDHKFQYECDPETRDPASVQYKVDALAKAAQAKGQKMVCVLGGGSSGLVVAKEMKEAGFAVVSFESLKNVGGVYSNCYPGGQLTSGSFVTTFSDTDLPQKHASCPEMLMILEFQNYLEDYAKTYGLMDSMFLSTAVTKLEYGSKCGGPKCWRVHYSPQHPTNKQTYFVDVDKFVYAAGVHQTGRIPEWKGAQGYKGEIVHSAKVKDFTVFKGKNVLVVGLGESAADMAYMTSVHAKQVYITDRSKNGFLVSRYYSPNAGAPPFSKEAVKAGHWVTSDSDTVPIHHAIPRAWMKEWNIYLEGLFSSGHGGSDYDFVAAYNLEHQKLHPFATYSSKSAENVVFAMRTYGLKIVGGLDHFEGTKTVITDDGSKIDDVDVVMLCTGYQREFPLLQGVLPDEFMMTLKDDGLFKKIMHWDLPDFGIIGMLRPSIGAIPPLAEMQSRWLAYVWSGQIPMPSKEYMCRTAKADRALLKEQYKACHINLVDYLPFMEAMGKEIGCMPPLNLRTFLFDRKLFYQCLFVPICGTQYRLRGPGAKPEVARKLLNAFPLNPGDYLWTCLWWNIQAIFFHTVTGNERYVSPHQCGDLARSLRRLFKLAVAGTVLGVGYVNREKIITHLDKAIPAFKELRLKHSN